MASSSKNREVIVLCPNGRRATIKTSISTSIGQIIEEACIKQKYDQYNYNLRHIKRTLDASSTLQYSNIPNHAQLELIEVSERRKEGSVTVNLVTDTGQRLIADFPASYTLWEILLHHENQNENGFNLPIASSGLEPFIVYTMRKIIGEDIKSVTLKSLGLLSGRCMIRYNVQPVLSENDSRSNEPSPIVIVAPKTCNKKKVIESDESKESEYENGDSIVPTAAHKTEVEPKIEEMDCDPAKADLQVLPTSVESVKTEEFEMKDQPFLDVKEELTRPDFSVEQNNTKAPNFAASVSGPSLPESSETPKATEQKQIPAVIPLSSHDSLLFSLDDAPPTRPLKEEGDDFFKLTVDEVRALHRDQIRELRNLEDAPLTTQAYRQLEKDSRLLSAMNLHPVTQLRICFPDRYVIQANFKPRSTIREVMDFLKPLLLTTDLDFYLYTPFPRTILAPDTSLVEAGCIPKARLYFGTAAEGVSFLSESALAKKSSFEGAANAVIQSRVAKSGVDMSSEYDGPEVPSKPIAQYSLDTDPPPSRRINSAGAASSLKQRPKWFKLGK